MSITADDLEYRLSVPDASAGNQLAQADHDDSLGKFAATTVWAGGGLHDLFSAVSGDDNANQTADYRCVFIVNKHTSLTWTDVVVWLPSQVAGGATIAIGVDPTPASPLTDTDPQAVSVSGVYAAPAGVVFSAPSSKPTGLVVGSIPPGSCRAIWIRRTPTNSAAAASDGGAIRCEGDTT